MNIKLIKSGKTDGACRALASEYHKRLKTWTRLDISEVRNDQQALKILTDLRSRGSCKIVCLDERGKMWSSPQLADFINQQRISGQIRTLCFVVGSPYGLGDEIKNQSDQFWSLSPAVFPSDLAWVLTNEQVYRAFSIINGSPYHHA